MSEEATATAEAPEAPAAEVDAAIKDLGDKLIHDDFLIDFRIVTSK
mgnify:CR=1 FL=1